MTGFTESEVEEVALGSSRDTIEQQIKCHRTL